MTIAAARLLIEGCIKEQACWALNSCLSVFGVCGLALEELW